MASVNVKGVNTLFDASVSAKSNVQQSSNRTESFDETLNGMRSEKSDEDKDFNVSQTKKADDDRASRFGNVGRKNQIKSEEEVTEEQIAAMSDEVVCQIKEMLMEQYDISEEELNVTMDSLEMTDDNLLNVADLTKIVMKLENVENQADLLTNPDFAKNLKDIISKTEAIKESVKPEDFNIQATVDEETEVDVNSETVSIVDDAVDAEMVGKSSEDEAVKTDLDNATDEVNVAEQTVEESYTTNDDDSLNDLHKNEDDKKMTTDENSTNENVAVQPQDFAKKLTEDLSAKVGETKANDIVRQVVEQTQLHVKQGTTSLEMQLYPEHLGKVLVQVVSRDGSITAQITAESEAAKNALESQLTLLKDNLNNQGVKVENVEVTIASHAFEQNMQGESNGNGEQNSSHSKKNRRNTDMFFDDISDEQIEVIDQEIMEMKGSTVSYSA